MTRGHNIVAFSPVPVLKGRWGPWLLAISVVLMLAVACSPGGGPTIAPTETPDPTATLTPSPTPGAGPEWTLEEVQVDGSTVNVLIRVYSTTVVEVTMNGRAAERNDDNYPILKYTFHDVAPGKHTVHVRGIIGHQATAEVTVGG